MSKTFPVKRKDILLELQKIVVDILAVRHTSRNGRILPDREKNPNQEITFSTKNVKIPFGLKYPNQEIIPVSNDQETRR